MRKKTPGIKLREKRALWLRFPISVTSHQYPSGPEWHARVKRGACGHRGFPMLVDDLREAGDENEIYCLLTA